VLIASRRERDEQVGRGAELERIQPHHDLAAHAQSRLTGHEHPQLGCLGDQLADERGRG
jgi:hypothetical protein